MQIHCINPGRFWEIAQSWASEFPGLDVRRAYQVDCGSQGLWPRDGDIATIDLADHLAATRAKIQSAVPAGSPPGLVSVDAEIGMAHWRAVSTGEWPARYVEHGLAWFTYIEQLLGAGFTFGWYGWPMRLDWPWLQESMQRATMHGSALFSRMDVLTPVLYDRLPGGAVMDRVAIEAALAESARLSELLGDKAVVPQLSIRHPSGEFVDLGQFERQLAQVLGWRDRLPMPGLAFWSDARDITDAQQTTDEMGAYYGPILASMLGAHPLGSQSPPAASGGSEVPGVGPEAPAGSLAA